MNWIGELLKDYPALSVARERLLLAQEQMERLEAENVLLKKKLQRCKKAYRKVKAIADRQAVSVEFVSRGGLKWKREGESFEPAPYCGCGEVMHRFPPMNMGRSMYWICSGCNRKVDFVEPPAS